MRTRILLQAENITADPLSNVRIKLDEIPLCRGSEFDAVGQRSVSQFSHEVTHGYILSAFGQRGSCRLNIHAVHLFPRQTLQQLKVFDRDYGRHVFAPARNNCALFSISGAVYQVGKLLPRF